MINIAPSPSIHSSIHFFHPVSIVVAEKSLLSKAQRQSSCLIQYHNNWKPFFFFTPPLYRHNGSVLKMSEYVIWHTVQTLWLVDRKNECIWCAGCPRKEKVRVWLSSQPRLKQSPVSEGAEDRHKVSSPAPLGAYACPSTSIFDRKEGLRADGSLKDNHSGLSGTGQANAKNENVRYLFSHVGR